ncbi:helix-turn-helix domain-containing protein [Bdellovibrio sp. HCB288]|uniref:helix-turn-helix domain-containing protein n=1 Tax=Bdellovibrio sp. HCB288 TaxID=3394355 RepID=UPI0039B51D1C
MKKTGEILKAAREERGLSLNEVGLSLKISSKVLKAIEDGDENQLPAKTFLRGFVKSYATFLRLDADKILETFYQEMGSTRPQPYIRPTSTPEKEAEVAKTTASSDEPEATVTPIRKSAPATSSSNDYSPLNKKNNTKTIVVGVLLVFLAGLIIFTKKMIDKYSKEAEVPTAEVAEMMEGATPVDGDAAPAEPLTSESPTPNASPLAQITKPEEKPEPISKATPVETPKASPSPSVSQSPSPTATVAATATAKASPSPTPTASVAATTTPTASPSPTASPTPEKAKPVELIVEALDTVEIEYASPSGKPQKIRLSAEQVHTFKSKSGLKINFSNGGAVNLILNGKELGIPGDLGKPIKLSY